MDRLVTALLRPCIAGLGKQSALHQSVTSRVTQILRFCALRLWRVARFVTTRTHDSVWQGWAVWQRGFLHLKIRMKGLEVVLLKQRSKFSVICPTLVKHSVQPPDFGPCRPQFLRWCGCHCWQEWTQRWLDQGPFWTVLDCFLVASEHEYTMDEKEHPDRCGMIGWLSYWMMIIMMSMT